MSINTYTSALAPASGNAYAVGSAAEAGVSRAVPRAVGDWRKRAFDFSMALAALILLLPMGLMIMAVIRLSSPGPVFFGHERIGRGGRRFRCLKFRTMVVNGDETLNQHFAANPAARTEWNETRKLKNDPRVTAIGAILRKTSADELPQLINIVLGEMSLVGPRPVVEDEMQYYGVHSGHYYAARPGLTGLWQVSGRSDVSYEARVNFDLAYCENWSMRNDCVLIARTVPAVLSRRGTY
jgi:exopolysaccharide production protein ExoY